MTEVLIVDDSPAVRKIARRVLEAMTLKAFEAEGGSQALAVCSLAMPDAILSWTARCLTSTAAIL